MDHLQTMVVLLSLFLLRIILVLAGVNLNFNALFIRAAS